MGSDCEGRDGVAIRAVEERKVYGMKDAQVEALRGISIEIEGGERVGPAGQLGVGEVDFIEPVGRSRPAQLGWIAGRRLGSPPTLGARDGPVPVDDCGNDLPVVQLDRLEIGCRERRTAAVKSMRGSASLPGRSRRRSTDLA